MSKEFEPGDQHSRHSIICPHCGHSRKADACEGDASEDPQEDECGECGKEFIRSAFIDITYRTKAKQ
jgi:DNA-directed RNA polymerase subunit RPC12/RpoP